MYDYLRGRIVDSAPGRIVLEVNGIGYYLNTADQPGESFGVIGKEVQVWTHLHLREDSQTLFGFPRKRQRELFRYLIKVNGVGPRLAIQILSGIQPEELIQVMADEDWKRLTLIPGIGPKTARRLLIQLKEKLTDQELLFSPTEKMPTDPVLSQAFNALQNLGIPPESIRKVLKDQSPTESLEEIVKKALSKLAP
ncbi:Holliday junction branch migration protein RuvA [candidate division LCP-89 bacterium B3_LCP]|uniref:Holliday junction branch migration complex subunit RuvA n=1 Tax=candidate division LCP-89 bacterium B3_LCP TaxID=2012998 RepID=A0A532V5Q5_UNCL8|nr:MAG: Holliday junction branch migration protein RuvA [candidate division LCP-89 bacterium B3_LCP]